MSKKSEIRKIWRECFPADSPQWCRMFFDAAYVDDEALTVCDPETGAVVSSLLLLPYSMTFHGANLGLAYVYGAGTLRRYRARGFMSQLMREALAEAADRGDTFTALIPATEPLRLYYRRFGFSTVFFDRPQRYTSLHRFPVEGEYVAVDPASTALFGVFERLMAERPCCVQHTRAQFLTLMDDARLSGHGFAAVAPAAGGDPVAMAWGVPDDFGSELCVRELLAVDADAARAALTELQRQLPGRTLTLMTQPADSAVGGNLRAGGMLRVVNAASALAAVAAANPDLKLRLRLRDDLLPDNSGVYTLAGGRLTVGRDIGAVNLDLTPPVLASMLFSSTPIAAITGLPGVRPRMSLMLD